MPITPDSVDRFFSGIFGPINRAAEPLIEHRPSAIDIINRRINKPVAGKPGAPTMSQQMIMALLSSLGGIGPARVGPGAFRGLPEFPVTERLWTDPHTGQIYKVPGYDTRRSATHPQDGPPSPGRSASSNVNLEDDIRKELINNRVKLLEEEKKLSDLYNSGQLMSNRYRRELYEKINVARNEIERLSDQLDTVGGHATREVSFDPIDYFPGRRRYLGDRTNKSTRGGGPPSEIRSMVESRRNQSRAANPSEVRDLMRTEFGYDLDRQYTSSRGNSTYQIYSDPTGNLPLRTRTPRGTVHLPPRNRFQVRYSDHFGNPGLVSTPERAVSVITTHSNPYTVNDIRSRVARQLGRQLPETPRQTPIPPEQLNFLQQLLGGP